MKLWIIYNERYVFSNVIAEMLQDRLENSIDVSVGKASKIKPSFLVEEKLDFLILGDIINKTIPSVVIQNWVYKYRDISEGRNLGLKVLSGFLISVNEINSETLWVEFVYDHLNIETIYPPILCLKLDKNNLAFETDVHAIVKEYSKKIIKFIMKIEDE